MEEIKKDLLEIIVLLKRLIKKGCDKIIQELCYRVMHLIDLLLPV